jgi:hypothetical protein
MHPILRIVFVFVVAVLGNLAFQILFMLLLPDAVPALLSYFAALGCAILAARLAWVKTASPIRGVLAYILVGAIATGAVGFAIGFFGPMIVVPESNQGPLLGILYTGPLGFVLGAVGGGIYGVTRGRR